MRLLASITLAMALSAGLAHANTTVKTPVFLSGDTVKPALLLPVPPKPDTPEGKAELDEVRAIVAAATAEQIKQAAEDDANESVLLYAKVIPGLDLTRLPATARLFKAVEHDENLVTNQAKAHFARIRPYELDHDIKTCVASALGKPPKSYPSGHSALGFTDGIILAHLIPGKAEIILARAKDYAFNRVVCGVHFRSDTVASQALATGISIELMHSTEFQKAFAEAKAELVAAGLTE